MNLFRRSARGIFGSASLLGHLLRGGAAALLLLVAFDPGVHPALALSAVAAALIAFRGCPMCWLFGLVETVAEKMKR